MPVRSTRGNLVAHLSKHPELDFGVFSVDDFAQFAVRQIEQLRDKKQSMHQYRSGSFFKGYTCKGCGKCFIRKNNGLRHTEAKTSVGCKSSDLCLVDISQTICGRLVPASAFKFSGGVPDGATIPISTTRDWLNKYVANDEKSERYIPIFHPMSRHGNADQVMSEFIDLWTMEPTEKERDLCDLLELGRIWLVERVRLETSMVPANYRAAIMVFEGQDEGDVKQNSTYNFRHHSAGLVPELSSLLKFAWRRSDQLSGCVTLLPFKEFFLEMQLNPFLVPRILHALLVEPVRNLFQHPIMVEYCLARCFRKRNGILSMVKADLSSSQVAAVISLLRAGTCGFLLSLDNMVQQVAPNACRLARGGVVMNLMCPFIRILKEMHAAKTKRRITTVAPSGDIAVDGFLFGHKVWSNLIPNVFAACKSLLQELLVGQQWHSFLDSTIPITVNIDSCRSVFFQVLLPDGKPMGSQSVLVASSLKALDLDRLASYLCVGFFGLGCGAMRGSELDESMLSDVNWHRNTVYYTSRPTKQYSSMASTATKKVEHKLPPCLSRCFLLFRLIMNVQEGFELKELVPRRIGAKHAMKEAIVELFNLELVPDKIQVRHLFTSITDVIFGDGTMEGALTAAPEVAQMSGHSAATHRQHYPTIVFDGRERIYRTFHQRLGGDFGLLTAEDPDTTELSSDDLLQALRLLAGGTANYLSKEQEKMVTIASSTLSDHAHVGLPCGGGKSMSWMTPAVARVMKRKSRKTTIVIVPYKFLGACHFDSALRSIEGKLEMDILSLTGQDIGESSLPGCLSEVEALPHLLFLTLEAMTKLIQHHVPAMTSWVEGNVIHRFIIDEIHTIYSEHFRSVYEVLPRMVRFGVPVMTLSATVPGRLVPSLLRHLGMSTDPSFLDVVMVDCHDGLGHFPSDFRFSISNSPRYPYMVADAIVKLLDEKEGHAIHVIANSRKVSELLVELLKKKCDSFRYVSAKTPKADMDKVAKDWSNGRFRVLISTTIALVGNENKHCRHVVILGYLFNLTNVIQAMGRLRPSQRTGGASVQLWVHKWEVDRLTRTDTQDLVAYNNLRGRNLVSPLDKELYLRVSGIRSLHDWMFLDKGCRLQNLSHRFGMRERPKCDVCDACRGTPTRTLAASSNRRILQSNEVRNRTMNVLKALLDECLNCSSNQCNGETCMRNLCYRCGSKSHYTSRCPDEKTAEKTLHSRACYHCFDLYNRRGFSNHNKESCPMKRRLRRMVFAKWPQSGSTYEVFLSSNFCSEEAFCTFVASLSVPSNK